MQKVSVIVPVFNTGKYLYKCIDSILNQTYKNIEILIIDDGSEKYTADICDDLADKDTRIRVFHKKNEGVSVARNYGLNLIEGDFIGFVDSDDWIDRHMFESLVSVMVTKDVDVVYCDVTTVWDDGRSEPDTFPCFNKSIGLESSKLSPESLCLMAGSVCRGLYKHSVIKYHHIMFPERLKFSEDRYFNLQVLANVKDVYYLKESYYFRYMRDGSCVNSYHVDAVSVILRSSNLMINYVLNHWSVAHKNIYVLQMVRSFMGCLYSVVNRRRNGISKFQEFKYISSIPQIHEALDIIEINDPRLFLLKSRQYFLLYILIWFHLKIKNK